MGDDLEVQVDIARPNDESLGQGVQGTRVKRQGTGAGVVVPRQDGAGETDHVTVTETSDGVRLRGGDQERQQFRGGGFHVPGLGGVDGQQREVQLGQRVAQDVPAPVTLDGGSLEPDLVVETDVTVVVQVAEHCRPEDDGAGRPSLLVDGDETVVVPFRRRDRLHGGKQRPLRAEEYLTVVFKQGPHEVVGGGSCQQHRVERNDPVVLDAVEDAQEGDTQPDQVVVGGDVEATARTDVQAPHQRQDGIVEDQVVDIGGDVDVPDGQVNGAVDDSVLGDVEPRDGRGHREQRNERADLHLGMDDIMRGDLVSYIIDKLWVRGVSEVKDFFSSRASCVCVAARRDLQPWLIATMATSGSSGGWPARYG